MNEKEKLSREEKAQLEEANAAALEKEIGSLSAHLEADPWNYKAFWQQSESIHKTFQKIKPLKNADRKKLWEIFSAVRDVVKKRQEVERKYQQWLLDIRRRAFDGYASELLEILQKDSKSGEDIEQILFLQDSLGLMLEEGWKGFPDTPDIALAAFRSDGKYSGRELAEESKKLHQLKKKCSGFLLDDSKKAFESFSERIAELEGKALSAAGAGRLKSSIRELRRELLAPIFNKAQREQLLARIDKLQGPKGKAPEGSNLDPKSDDAVDVALNGPAEPVEKKPRQHKRAQKPEKNKEVNALLAEIEMDVLGKK